MRILIPADRSSSCGLMPQRGLGAAALVSLAVLLWGAGARGAMEIEGIDNATAPASNYDRYDNSAAWIGNPANWPGGAPPMPGLNGAYVWSGVGRTTVAGDSRWGTMISPSFIISANHFHPAVGNTIQFNYDNDPNGPQETRTVIAGSRLQTDVSGDMGDVWIGELSAPVSSNVAIYPILNMGFQTDYNKLGISTFGISTAYPGDNVSDVRMGRNTIDTGTAHYYTGFNPGDTGGVTEAWAFQYTFNNAPANRGVGDDEAQVHAGDSGGPTFFLYAGGSPALLGIHWLEGTNGGGMPLSLDTHVSKYVSDINTGMSQLAVANVALNPLAVGDTASTIAPVLGDLNLDGHFNAADISAMEAALANLPSYESKHQMNDDYLNYIADLNGDGKVNNADLQKLLSVLKMGGGSVSSVPEPAGVVLLALGGLAALGSRGLQHYRRGRAPRCKAA